MTYSTGSARTGWAHREGCSEIALQSIDSALAASGIAKAPAWGRGGRCPTPAAPGWLSDQTGTQA